MRKSNDLLYLSRDDIKAVPLSGQSMIESIENLCLKKEEGTVFTAPKSSLTPDEDRFYMSTMGATRDPAFMAVKSLGVSSNNSAIGLESMGSLITLHDGMTGHPIAIMDGDWITAVRTAALTGVAAKYLARQDSDVIAFIGCGVQAQSHLAFFSKLYPLTEIRALGRGAASRDALCANAAGMGLIARAVEDPKSAMDGAKLIITSVPHRPGFKPFLNMENVSSGAFIGMVDLARSWYSESLESLDQLFIDDRAQESAMKSPMVELAHVSGDLEDLVSGREVGRTDDNQRTAFSFRGMAIGDLALAIEIYQYALQAGLGRTLPR